MRNKALVVAGIFVVAVLGVAGASASASGGGEEVEARGGFAFEPNKEIQGTLNWHSGELKIRSGEDLRILSNDEIPGEPHVFTIVNQVEQPQTLEELFVGGCDTCNTALAAHDTNGNQQLDEGDQLVVNVGPAGLNEVGDSVALPDEATMVEMVTAPAGTTLYFMCAIHPEMQGVLEVR